MCNAKLCKFCSQEKWYPFPIDWYVAYLTKLISSGEKAYELRKNLAYNLQYLRYLIETLEQLNLSSVLITQTYKAFIITGIGIIECILYFLVVSNNLHKQVEWQKIKTTKTNPFKIPSGDILMIENVLLKKLPEPIEEEISFHSLISKAEKKHLLGKDHDIYKKLNYLRKLRNKIHLHLVERGFDTDWNNFNKDNFKIMGEVLYTILTYDFFSPTEQEKEHFSFLLRK